MKEKKNKTLTLLYPRFKHYYEILKYTFGGNYKKKNVTCIQGIPK